MITHMGIYCIVCTPEFRKKGAKGGEEDGGCALTTDRTVSAKQIKLDGVLFYEYIVETGTQKR